MELLIPGLLLVALMVYVSTRIKKAAAKAYEPEIIETEEFVVQKPEGFLHVIGGDPKYAMEVYSKEFGGPGQEDVRKATATLRIDEHTSADQILAEPASQGARIVSDTYEVIDDIRYRSVETEFNEKGIDFTGFRKLVEHRGRVFDLDARRLSETNAEVATGIETLVDSFRVK